MQEATNQEIQTQIKASKNYILADTGVGSDHRRKTNTRRNRGNKSFEKAYADKNQCGKKLFMHVDSNYL